MVSDDVTRLPVKFKAPPSGEQPQLRVVDRYSRETCNHRWQYGTLKNVTYLIRDGETEVECGQCGTKLDPMWVLRLLATEENKWRQTRTAYQDEMKRLSERQSTKCKHCGKMTRISRS